jgi:hypothetical protein
MPTLGSAEGSTCGASYFEDCILGSGGLYDSKLSCESIENRDAPDGRSTEGGGVGADGAFTECATRSEAVSNESNNLRRLALASRRLQEARAHQKGEPQLMECRDPHLSIRTCCGVDGGWIFAEDVGMFKGKYTRTSFPLRLEEAI